ERDAMGEWVAQHRPELMNEYPEFGSGSAKKASKWTFAVPAELAAPYAIGDVVRTRKLFDLLKPVIDRQGMCPAYDRERQLLPILMHNEREGIRVDVAELDEDCERYGMALCWA